MRYTRLVPENLDFNPIDVLCEATGLGMFDLQSIFTCSWVEDILILKWSNYNGNVWIQFSDVDAYVGLNINEWPPVGTDFKEAKTLQDVTASLRKFRRTGMDRD